MAAEQSSILRATNDYVEPIPPIRQDAVNGGFREGDNRDWPHHGSRVLHIIERLNISRADEILRPSSTEAHNCIY
jgi:hypothetical protein